MENEYIHDGFPEKEVRNFLAKQRSVEGNKCNYITAIDVLEKQILHLQEQILHMKALIAINTIIEYKGWKMFDVSDIVKYDPETYFEFVGTKEEFELFMKNLIKEKI